MNSTCIDFNCFPMADRSMKTNMLMAQKKSQCSTELNSSAAWILDEEYSEYYCGSWKKSNIQNITVVLGERPLAL